MLSRRPQTKRSIASAMAKAFGIFVSVLLVIMFAMPAKSLAATATMLTYVATPGYFPSEDGGLPETEKTQPITWTVPTIIIDDVPVADSSEWDVMLMFDANGGACAGGEASTSGVNKHTITRTFDSWNDRNTFDGKVYHAGDEYVANPDLDGYLYAHYVEKEDVVTAKFPTATRDGYAFEGWYTKVDGGVRVGGAGDEVPAGAQPAEGESIIVYYAHWDANKVDVTFVGKDGSPVIEKQTIAYGTDATAPTAPEVEGYTFTGWDREFTNVTEDITVTALYKANGEAPSVYKALFDSNGATGTNDPASIEFKPGDSLTLPKCTLTRDGYVFKGWSLSKDGSSKLYLPESTLANMDSSVSDDGSVTFYAQWSPVSSGTGSTSIAKTGDIALYVIGGVALVALAAGAGFVLYRRRNK